MQNQNVVLDGTGKATVKASCPAEAFEFYCLAHTFTFQYALRADEAPTLATGPNSSGTPDPSKAAQPNGDAVSAEPWTATLFKFIAESARNKPWAAGETVGFLVGTAADTIVCRPRRAGGS
jgi:hypothetical protein